MNFSDLFTQFDLSGTFLAGAVWSERRLSELQDAFADRVAYRAALSAGDPVIYAVAKLAPAQGEGALNLALNRIHPGQIGREYYLTKGHFHAWRAAGEYYIGLQGEGVMLLEDAARTESQMVPLQPHSAVYVPGYTAHRTINVGKEPLVYLTIFPAEAGNDYTPIAEHNFAQVMIAVDGIPTQMARTQFMESLDDV